MQLIEPFIWTFDDSKSILLSSMILIFLFADMPFVTTATPFFLVRTSRKKWLIGQGLYILLATMLYMLFVMFITSLISMKNSFPGNIWSPTAVVLGYSKAGEVLAVPSSMKTMEMSTPYSCAATIFVLMLLYALVMVSLMLLCNLKYGQIGGVLAAFGFSIYGFLLDPQTIKMLLKLPDYESYIANVWVGWVSPLNHATFHTHNFGYDLLPQLWQSYLLCILLVLLCFFFSLQVIRTYSFVFTGTGGK
ncbi:MAG: hypothetical protein PUB22_05615 [Clostridiales bacterium]|nr:hypothetical protein [Clostridiales bacterium]